jgi:hypothetical protein
MVVYILELSDGFYSISRFSISQIKNGSGTSWTKLHQPVSVIKTIYKDEEYDEDFSEDDIVYEFMEKYGIEKVRGGSFNSVVLSEYQISILNQKLKKHENTYNKNKENSNNSISYHYNNDDFTTVIYDSSKKNQIANTVTNNLNKVSSSANICSYCEMSFANEIMVKKHEEKCMDTYFTKSKNDGKQCDRCGRHTHTTQHCKAKTDIYGYSI